MHYFAPAGLPTMPKNVIFVIDKSGSMMGRKMQQVGPTGQGEALKTLRCLALSALVQQADPPSSIFLIRGLPRVKVGQSMGLLLPLEHSPCPHSRFGPGSSAQGHMNPQGGPTETPTLSSLPLTRPGRP